VHSSGEGLGVTDADVRRESRVVVCWRSRGCRPDFFVRRFSARTAWPTFIGRRREVGRRREGGGVGGGVWRGTGQPPARAVRGASSGSRQVRRAGGCGREGNHGERVVAELLDVLDGADWCVLHDRYKPGFKANLDHVVVGPPGLFVIDAKNWKPAPLRFDDRGMSLRGYRKDEELRAAADCARLVLQRAISAHAVLPAVGVLAFVQDMGLRVPVEHHGVWVLQSEDLLAWLTSQEAVLDRATVQRVGATLDAALPPREGKAKPFTFSEISPPGATPRQPAGRAQGQVSTRRATRGPHTAGPPRRRAGRNRESFDELVVKLIAAVVFVFVVVPMILNGIPERIAEVTRPQPSAPPVAAVPVPPEQGPSQPSG
jgi:hypothetical protein